MNDWPRLTPRDPIAPDNQNSGENLLGAKIVIKNNAELKNDPFDFNNLSPQWLLKSNAVGMAVAQPNDFEIDFVRNPVSGSAAWFFVIMLKFILTLIFESEIHEKIF